MNKILQNFETAANGEYTPSKQESSDMKMILESFYEVAADDAKPQQLDEIASVSVSGETADEVAQLVRLMNDAGAPEAAPVGPQPTTMHEPAPCDGPPDMPPMITPKMMDDFETKEESVAEDDWDNEPEENYQNHQTMTHDLSGGINGRKKSYKRAEPGDNPMAVESDDNYDDRLNMAAEDYFINHKGEDDSMHSPVINDLADKYDVDVGELSDLIRNDDPSLDDPDFMQETIKKQLYKALSEKKNSKPDYLDLDKDGDTKEPMKKAAKDAKKKKAPVKESENATDGKTETIDIGWGEEFEVKHTPQGRLLIGVDIPAQVYHSGHGGENAERFIDFVYNMDTKKVIEWPEKMSYEYEELDKEAFLEVVDWIATKVETKLKYSGTKFESENSDKEVDEAGKMKGGGDDPCWKGYKMVGTKKKGGKEVPNCVPREGVEELENEQIDEISADLAKRVKDKAKASELDYLSKGYEKINRTKNIPFVSKMGRKSAERDLEQARRRKRLAKLANRKLGGMGDYRYDDEGHYGREGPAKVLARRDENDIEESAPKNNPVAKHAGKFNKAKVEPDKKQRQKRGYQKHKDKDMQMESAPVFNRYVKPLLDKSPKQIVEFYDTEAYAIIDRLSRESRALAKQNVNTRVHDSIVGKLRENLSVLPETKLDEMRSRRSS